MHDYWEWLLHQASIRNIKISLEIFEEIQDGPTDKDKDLLFAWINNSDNKATLCLEDEVDILLVQRAVDEGYANNLNDVEIAAVGRDPFLIAHALADKDRCIVTVEGSKPVKQRQNKRIPDVCKGFSIPCCDTFMLNRTLGFRTDWKSKT